MERITFLVITILHIALCCDIPNITSDGYLLDVYQFDHANLTWNGQGFDNVTWFFMPKDSDSTYPYPFHFSGNVHILDSGRTLSIGRTPMDASGVFMSLATCTRTGLKKSINITLQVHDCVAPVPINVSATNVSVVFGKPTKLHCKVDFNCIGDYPVPVTWRWNDSDTESITGMGVYTKRSGTVIRTTLTIQNVRRKYVHHPFRCVIDIPFEKVEEKEVYLIQERGENVKTSSAKAWIVGIIVTAVFIIIIIGLTYNIKRRYSTGTDVPNITDESYHDNTYESEQTKLTWTGDGFDNVTWTFIPTDSDQVYPYPFPFPGNVRFSKLGRTMTIERTPIMASGIFVSTALCTQTGKIDSINFTLNVHSCRNPKPSISGITNVSVALGQPVKLFCFVEFQCIGYFQPFVHITWRWNQTDIETTKGINVSTNISESRTEYASTLTIQEVTDLHFRDPFICAVDIIFFPTEEKEIFLIKMERHEEILGKAYVAPLILGVTIPIPMLVVILVAVYICWPFFKWRMIQTITSRGFKTGTRNPQKRHDVFLYYNDGGKEEAGEIIEFLSENGYNVLSEISPGKSYSSMREMIEDSASAIIIATEDEMLSSVLLETTEEICIPNVIVLTKHQRTFHSPFLNSVKLNYTYDSFTCFSFRKKRFYTELRVNLPPPRTSYADDCPVYSIGNPV